MKDPEDQCPLIHRAHSLNGVLAPVDVVAHLTSSPCCRGTGCSSLSTAGGGSSNIYGGSELYMHSDMQEISNEARITGMREKNQHIGIGIQERREHIEINRTV